MPTRTFGGTKNFNLCGNGSHANMKRLAKRLRKQGKLARVVKMKGSSEVWCRKKPYGATLRAHTYGEEPKKRKKRRKMPKRLAAEESFNACVKRRKGAKGRKRCTSLMYADCINMNGTTRKTKHCRQVARARIY